METGHKYIGSTAKTASWTSCGQYQRANGSFRRWQWRHSRWITRLQHLWVYTIHIVVSFREMHRQFTRISSFPQFFFYFLCGSHFVYFIKNKIMMASALQWYWWESFRLIGVGYVTFPQICLGKFFYINSWKSFDLSYMNSLNFEFKQTWRVFKVIWREFIFATDCSTKEKF